MFQFKTPCQQFVVVEVQLDVFFNPISMCTMYLRESFSLIPKDLIPLASFSILFAIFLMSSKSFKRETMFLQFFSCFIWSLSFLKRASASRIFTDNTIISSWSLLIDSSLHFFSFMWSFYNKKSLSLFMHICSVSNSLKRGRDMYAQACSKGGLSTHVKEAQHWKIVARCCSKKWS